MDTARIGASVHLALWQVKGNDWQIAGMKSSCLFQGDVLCSVIFRSMSLGPICMYTARWREFKGNKVSCLRKQCNDKAWIHIYLNHYVSWERSGLGQPKCESCSPKRQAGIQIFFLSPVIAKRQNALCIQVVVQFHSCFKFWFLSVCLTIISIGNSMICSDIWHKYQEWFSKLSYKKVWVWVWNIMSGIYAKYHVQIMLLFVYTTIRKRFVIFTFRYFKLRWNTTALSQSNGRNFSCSRVIIVCIIWGLKQKKIKF